jgi:3-oxoacyl-[acyl-carrier protein] reductase
MDLGLTGKVAMVAGASRGLGYAVARALAAEGALVSIGSRDESAIAEAARRIGREASTDPLGVAVDLRSAEAILGWHARTVDRFGGLDLLFVNTGGPPPGAALSFDDAAWTGAFELLVLSAVRLVRAAAPSMTARGGGAVLVSTSTAVREPIANLALSNIVRSSVAAMAKTLANELAPQRVRVNHLLPGRFDTDRIRELDANRARAAGTTPEEVRAGLEKTIPIGRYGQPEEYATAAVFLLSDAARYITGASLVVDGGMLRAAG